MLPLLVILYSDLNEINKISNFISLTKNKQFLSPDNPLRPILFILITLSVKMSDLNYYPGKVWNLAIHISLSCFIYCFAIAAMNSITNNIGSTLQWGDSYLMTSIFTTLYPVGCTIGTIIGAPLSKANGSRHTIISCNIIFIIGTLICIVPTNYTFGFGRFLTGVVGGVFITVPAVFINEMTPDAMTGQVGTLVQQACNLAFLVSYALGLVVPTSNLDSDPWNYFWMFIIFFPAIFSFYQIYFFQRVFKFESPKWLISRGRIEEAKSALRFVYKENGVESGIQRLSDTEAAESKDKEQKEETAGNKERLLSTAPTYKEILCSKRYRKVLRISALLNIGQQTSGSMVINLYSTTIFEDMGGGKFFAKVLTVVLGLVTFFSGIVTIPLISKYGRRTLMIIGQVGLTLILFTLGAFTSFVETSVELRALFIYLYFCVFAFSLGATFWAYIGEVCNDKCISIGLTLNLTTVVLLSFLFPVANSLLGISQCFFIFSALAFLLLLYEIVEVFETKGLTKQQITQKTTGDY